MVSSAFCLSSAATRFCDGPRSSSKIFQHRSPHFQGLRDTSLDSSVDSKFLYVGTFISFLIYPRWRCQCFKKITKSRHRSYMIGSQTPDPPWPSLLSGNERRVQRGSIGHQFHRGAAGRCDPHVYVQRRAALLPAWTLCPRASAPLFGTSGDSEPRSPKASTWSRVKL